MKLHQLNYVVSVVDAGLSISNAALRTHTSQPGVSKQIQLLEEELGGEIFIRTGKRLTGVTKIGQEVISMGREVLAKVNDIKALSNVSKQNMESLRVGANHVQASFLAGRHLSLFNSTNPNIELIISEDSQDNLEQLILCGQLDAAFTTAPSRINALTSHKLEDASFTLIAPYGHSLSRLSQLTLEEIAKHPIITYAPDSDEGQLIQSVFEKAGLDINVRMVAKHTSTVKTAVGQGFGVGFIVKQAFKAREDRLLYGVNADHLIPNLPSYALVSKNKELKTGLVNLLHTINPNITF